MLNWIRSVPVTAFATSLLLASSVHARADDQRPAYSTQEQADYRQPIDIALDPTGQAVAVACEKTGSILVLDRSTKKIIQTLHVASSLNDLQPLANDSLLAISTRESKVFLMHWNEKQLSIQTEVSTSTAPIRAEQIGNTNRFRLACLWSRRMETYSVEYGEPSNSSATVKLESQWDLSIAPKCFVTLPERHLVVVADAFGSTLQLLDDQTGEVRASHRFLGSSICGIQVNQHGLIGLAYADLNDFAKTNENDIHWGMLLANDLRWIPIETLLNKRGEEIYADNRLQPVGVPGNGGAELTHFQSSPSGKLVITCGGTDQVAIGTEDGYRFLYVNVGRYPVSCTIDANTDTAFIANKFDDSVSVVDLKNGKLYDNLWLGPVRKLNDAELGEKLFHDASLSHDRWMTCASCHVDGHTNGLLADNLGDRNYGAAKRVPSLLGIAKTEPYSWLGHDATMQQQITRSVLKTMQSYRILDRDEVDHIASYCESLPAAPSLTSARTSSPQERVAIDQSLNHGKSVFVKVGCADCHVEPLYTSADVFNVGFRDEKGAKQFNPPSLRGVSQRGPGFFHDNRAENLEQAIALHSEALNKHLSESDRQAIRDFLLGL